MCKLEFNHECDLTRRCAIWHCRTFLCLRWLPLHRFDVGFVEHLEMRVSTDYFWFRYSNHEHSLSFGSLLAARLITCFLPFASYRLWMRSFFYRERYLDNGDFTHYRLYMNYNTLLELWFKLKKSSKCQLSIFYIIKICIKKLINWCRYIMIENYLTDT